MDYTEPRRDLAAPATPAVVATVRHSSPLEAFGAAWHGAAPAGPLGSPSNAGNPSARRTAGQPAAMGCTFVIVVVGCLGGILESDRCQPIRSPARRASGRGPLSLVIGIAVL